MTDQAKRILVVEDDPTTAEILCFHLETRGFQVTLASNGTSALRCIEQEQFALVITDYFLPNVTGSDICKHLRDDERHAETPIILITGYDLDLNVSRLTESLNLQAAFPKPFNPMQVVETVKECLAGGCTT